MEAKHLQSRVAIVTFPLHGHQNPMMRLACRLANLGIRVTFFTSKWFEKSAKPSKAYEELIKVVGIEGGLDDNQLNSSNDAIADVLRESEKMRQPFEKLVLADEEENGTPFACLIVDACFPWLPEVRHRFVAGFWASTVACASVMVTLPDLVAKGYLPAQGEKLLSPGANGLALAGIPFYFHTANEEDLRMSIEFGQVLLHSGMSCLLLNSFEGAEKQRIQELQSLLPCPCLPVGPLMATDQNGIARHADRCLEWLDQQEPKSVVYVSFGTLAYVSAQQFEELALGLESSGASFLWVVRPTLVDKQEDVETFLEEFRKRTSAKGLIVAWANQLQILAHPSVGLFLSHCGWNSTLEAVWSGVPVLAWPLFDEQNVCARYLVHDWKAGTPISDAALAKSGVLVSRKEVRDGVRSGLRDESLRYSMKRASKAAREAVQPGGSSFSSIEKLVLAIKAGSWSS
ncbi:hypothetical protein SELMODRAFT_93648 [Selaginella moellendorffii]|uniref:Glycosyltransferase n=1 Tax=Selaginella moellendorffii TaxID=88036 RepID=D8RH10_SELML|nr:UDP-glycosyltransferase 84A1 [Selaginella moellendorffii]EFJ28457.1 hypothetical protein SELMODRAFT_93648 [Selaginella moellendorffii]|eukprot:XP_002970327.1 UDP-glycosyltransferase 84A1 [Selaginella moellendorffii]